jgi:hypothetical protein
MKIFGIVCRTGSAVKNRWNWMTSPRREDVMDTLVKQNARMFKQILMVGVQWCLLNPES